MGRLDLISDYARKSRENGWPGWQPIAIQGGRALLLGDLDAAEKHYLQVFPQRREYVVASFRAIRQRRIDPATRRMLDGLDAYGPPGLARWPVEVAAGDLDAAFATAYSQLGAASLIRPDGSGGPPHSVRGATGETARADWWYPADFRRDPRFGELVRAVGLVGFWRKNGWPDLCRPAGDTVTCQ